MSEVFSEQPTTYFLLPAPGITNQNQASSHVIMLFVCKFPCYCVLCFGCRLPVSLVFEKRKHMFSVGRNQLLGLIYRKKRFSAQHVDENGRSRLAPKARPFPSSSTPPVTNNLFTKGENVFARTPRKAFSLSADRNQVQDAQLVSERRGKSRQEFGLERGTRRVAERERN